jgi:histidinol-phosphate aminotransferase
VDPLKFLRADWDEIEPYHPVKPLDVLAAEIGLPVDRLVKLDANENLYGPHPAVREAIARADHHIYPDPGQTRLREAVAAFTGVAPANVVAGQGADDLIDLVFRLFHPAAVVDNVPTFGMYRFLARINGARLIDATRLEGFAVDVEANERAVAEEGASVVFLTSPNNPTGNLLPLADLERLLALDALVVVDEAYIEFSGGTATPLLAGYPNLILLRTFSKWAALAGARVGYALCHEAIAERLMAIKQPYNVSVAAEAGAVAALEHRAEIFETVRCMVAERDRIADLVGALGWLRPVPSAADFVLFEVHGRTAKDVAAALRTRGVLVRYYDNPLLRNYIRISAGRPEDTDRLLEALHALEAE